MPRSADNKYLNYFAIFTALAALLLIAMGGLVTSHEAGLAVPDWPTTYGYNMFLFPISQWKGGIFYEHTHRLMASGVGLLTVILAIWLWVKEPRAWLRWLGVTACFLVVLQGVLGGLRVVALKDAIGIFHAALAQLFLAVLCAIALFTSRWWRQLQPAATGAPASAGLARLFLAGTLIIFAQLMIAATMRHQHAGLAIPDFPLAYHKLWPAMDAASVQSYNANRSELLGEKPITAFQIGLQMAHRLMALLILCAVGWCAWQARRQLGARHSLARLALVWLGFIGLQIILGASTIWTNKAADVATAHVVVGAVSLVTGALLTIVSFRVLIPARAAESVAGESAQSGFAPGKPAASAWRGTN
jgi:cytochrome c oxidase assembly protein subunit 15